METADAFHVLDRFHFWACTAFGSSGKVGMVTLDLLLEKIQTLLDLFYQLILLQWLQKPFCKNELHPYSFGKVLHAGLQEKIKSGIMPCIMHSF